MEYYIAATKQLCEDLELLHQNEIDVNIRATKAAKQIKKTLTSFRTRIRKEGFNTAEEEIHFFKYIKPKIQAYLIFYSLLAEIETCKFHMSDEELRNLIDKKVRMFRHIMRENIEFVKYYQTGMTHLDKLYFVRDSDLGSINKISTNMLLDPEFNVSHDHVAANILAFDLFKKHLAPKPELQATIGAPAPKLKWTGNKLDLVELIYALHASGAVNHGDADLKEIKAGFEQIFKVEIGEIYRAFQDIASRKKEQIKFVSRLEDLLAKRIEDQDELSMK